jgi:hypothetical protein
MLKAVTHCLQSGTCLGSSMPAMGLKLMPVHMSTAAPKSMSFTAPLFVTRMFSCATPPTSTVVRYRDLQEHYAPMVGHSDRRG